jgi:hypothetical protein
VGMAGEDRYRTAREQPLQRRHRSEPKDAGADDEDRLSVGGGGAQESVAGDRDRSYRLAARSGITSGTGCSIEVCARTCSPHPPPRSRVKPSDRPVVRIRLSRLRHEDVHPRLQLAHNGSIARTAHGRHGSTATRVPTGNRHSIPASTSRPAIS